MPPDSTLFCLLGITLDIMINDKIRKVPQRDKSVGFICHLGTTSVILGGHVSQRVYNLIEHKMIYLY